MPFLTERVKPGYLSPPASRLVYRVTASAVGYLRDHRFRARSAYGGDRLAVNCA